MHKYCEIEKELSEVSRKYTELSDSYQHHITEIQMERRGVDAFFEVYKFFLEQTKLQKIYLKEAQPHEISKYVASIS